MTSLGKFEIPTEKFITNLFDDKIENDLKVLENVSEVIIKDKPEEKEIINDAKKDIKDIKDPIKEISDIETTVKDIEPVISNLNDLWDKLDGPTH